MANPSLNLKLALGAILFLIISLLLIALGNAKGGFDPIAFTIWNIPVHWYGITMAVSILTGVFVAMRANKSFFHLDEEALSGYLIAAIIGGIIGARLLFVLLKWPEYQGNPAEIFYLNQGGLSIHGALLGGALALWLTAKQAFLPVANLVALALPLSQAIGRLGNFFNQEAYGGPTSLPWKMFVASPHRPAGLEGVEYFHPTFMYEGLLNLILFAFLLHIAKSSAQKHLTLIYLILYSVVRFVIEFFRIDSDKLLTLTIAQWASLLIILVCYFLLSKPWTSKP